MNILSSILKFAQALKTEPETKAGIKHWPRLQDMPGVNSDPSDNRRYTDLNTLHVEKVGDRWMICHPDCTPAFMTRYKRAQDAKGGLTYLKNHNDFI